MVSDFNEMFKLIDMLDFINMLDFANMFGFVGVFTFTANGLAFYLLFQLQ